MTGKSPPSIGFTLCVLAIAACGEPTSPSRPEIARDRPAIKAELAVAANSWQIRRSMPAPARYRMAAGAVNGIIYVIGGDDIYGSGFLSNVEAYNVATNTWSARQPLPGPRAYLNGATPINGKIYVAGGARPLTPPYIKTTRILFVYNPATNLWEKKADMPIPGMMGVQGAIGGLLYVYAYVDDPGADYHRFFRYNPATNTWTILPSPPRQHNEGIGGVIGGRFYLTSGGGGATGSYTRSLHVYNPATNTWVTKAPMHQSRGGPHGGVINGKLYVAGGSIYTPNNPLTVEVYDPVSNTWKYVASMPNQASYGASAAVGGRLFVLGGWEQGTALGVTRRVMSYTP
jgi:N-acetylneuraminic acid mutarotase